MLAHFPLVKRNVRQAISSCQFVCISDTHILNSNILYHALKRKVLPISTRTLRTMFSLGSVAGGSKSAEMGPYPLGHRDDISSHLKYYRLYSNPAIQRIPRVQDPPGPYPPYSYLIESSGVRLSRKH